MPRHPPGTNSHTFPPIAISQPLCPGCCCDALLAGVEPPALDPYLEAACIAHRQHSQARQVGAAWDAGPLQTG